MPLQPGSHDRRWLGILRKAQVELVAMSVSRRRFREAFRTLLEAPELRSLREAVRILNLYPNALIGGDHQETTRDQEGTTRTPDGHCVQHNNDQETTKRPPGDKQETTTTPQRETTRRPKNRNKTRRAAGPHEERTRPLPKCFPPSISALRTTPGTCPQSTGGSDQREPPFPEARARLGTAHFCWPP